MAQFLSESLIVTFLALFLAVDLVVLALPAFNELTGKQFMTGLLLEAWMPAGIIAGTLLIGIIAGSYPAFFLSSFRPAGVLKASAATGKGNRGFRYWYRPWRLCWQPSAFRASGRRCPTRFNRFVPNKK